MDLAVGWPAFSSRLAKSEYLTDVLVFERYDVRQPVCLGSTFRLSMQESKFRPPSRNAPPLIRIPDWRQPGPLTTVTGMEHQAQGRISHQHHQCLVNPDIHSKPGAKVESLPPGRDHYNRGVISGKSINKRWIGAR
jgi:hypothetical protein